MIKGIHTGIDTETIEGKTVLICSPKRGLYLPKTFEDIMKFLISIDSNEGHHIWTYNLTYDASGIIKFLPDDNIKELAFDNKTVYKGNEITFIPSKFFSIKMDGRKDKCTLVDAAQFFSYMSLDVASKYYLNDKKIDNPIVDFFKLQDEQKEMKTPELLYKYLENNKEVLMEYCKKDAYLASKLGEKIDQSCYNIYRFKLETYTSNAKIGEKYTELYLNNIFKEKNLNTTYTNKEGKKIINKCYPKVMTTSKVSLFAESAYRGGLFELWQRGMFGECTDLDINSAYPFHMLNLPHWANGRFVELDALMITQIENNELKPEYGWVGCIFDCSYVPYDSFDNEEFEEKINNEDFDVKVSNNKIFYPTGLREQVITLDEYYFMKKYNFHCELQAGFIWERKQGYNGYKYPNPFEWIKSTYDRKTQIKKDITLWNKTCKPTEKRSTKTDMDYLICKIAMNGTYGKTVQKEGMYRNLYNPMYGSYITAGCRIQIASFILNNNLKKDVLCIATDGILLKGIHNFTNSEEIGEMEVNHYFKALLIGSGMHQLFSKDNKGKIEISSRLRGLTSAHNYNILGKLEELKDKDSFLFEKRRPIKLKECLVHINILSIKDLNRFISFGRTLRVNTDKKRQWKHLKNFSELLNCQIAGKRWTVKQIENKEYQK